MSLATQQTLSMESVEAPGPLRFYWVPIARRYIVIRDPHPVDSGSELMEIDGLGLFVNYCYGPKPTEYEVRRHLEEDQILEKNLAVFVEASSPQDACKIFQEKNPSASHCTNPALRLDTKRRQIKLLPSCNAMTRRSDKIYCAINENDEGNIRPCIVERDGTWPPSCCPIDKTLHPYGK